MTYGSGPGDIVEAAPAGAASTVAAVYRWRKTIVAILLLALAALVLVDIIAALV